MSNKTFNLAAIAVAVLSLVSSVVGNFLTWRQLHPEADSVKQQQINASDSATKDQTPVPVPDRRETASIGPFLLTSASSVALFGLLILVIWRYDAGLRENTVSVKAQAAALADLRSSQNDTGRQISDVEKRFLDGMSSFAKRTLLMEVDFLVHDSNKLTERLNELLARYPGSAPAQQPISTGWRPLTNLEPESEAVRIGTEWARSFDRHLQAVVEFYAIRGISGEPSPLSRNADSTTCLQKLSESRVNLVKVRERLAALIVDTDFRMTKAATNQSN